MFLSGVKARLKLHRTIVKDMNHRRGKAGMKGTGLARTREEEKKSYMVKKKKVYTGRGGACVSAEASWDYLRVAKAQKNLLFVFPGQRFVTLVRLESFGQYYCPLPKIGFMAPCGLQYRFCEHFIALALQCRGDEISEHTPAF